MKKIAPIFLIILLFLSGCNMDRATKGVKQTAAEAAPKKPIYLMAGTVEANQKTDVTSKVTAKVAEVVVEIGTEVDKGQALIKLDTKDLQAQLDQAKAGVAIAEANLEKALKGARPELKLEAEALVDSANKSYDNAKNNYNRINKLFLKGFSSKQQLEIAEGQMASAKGQLKSAKEKLNLLRNGERKETISLMKAQVKQAKAVLKMAQNQLDDCIITAPISGVITTKEANVGELVSPGRTLVSIMNTDDFVVKAYLPVTFKDKIKSGQQVEVRISELANKLLTGKVMAIDPAIDQNSKKILVKVRLNGEDTTLKPGMFAEIGLKL